jgi:Holliday junction resolvasome RuvABC endonuclease subunit
MHIPNKILAINPGTRELGIAVLEGKDLLYYGVKIIRGQKSPQALLRKIAAIIGNVISEYDPLVLAIEKPSLVRRSDALVALVAEKIKATAREYGLTVNEYEPQAVRQFLCQSEKANKRETAKVITSQFCELSRYFDRKGSDEIIYWGKMFDAVAVGLMYEQQSRSELSADDSRIVASKHNTVYEHSQP